MRVTPTDATFVVIVRAVGLMSFNEMIYTL